MKFAVFICFLGIGLVSGDTERECKQGEEGCTEALDSFLSAETPEEFCKGLDAAIECLDDFVEDCVEDQSDDDELEEDLEELRKAYTELCVNGALVPGDTEQGCKQRAEGCVRIGLDSLSSAKTPEGFCKGLDAAIECLDDVVDDCVEDQPVKDEVEEGLKELRKAYTEQCEKGDHEESDDEAEKCIRENAEALYDCAQEGTNEALEMVLELKTDDEDVLKCLLYGRMAECFVDKVRDKCGEELAVQAEKELQDVVPSEIQQACEAAASFSFDHYNIQLLDKKRK